MTESSPARSTGALTCFDLETQELVWINGRKSAAILSRDPKETHDALEAMSDRDLAVLDHLASALLNRVKTLRVRRNAEH